MDRPRLVLASSSPRRLALMRSWGLHGFDVVPPGISEDIGERDPRKLVKRLSVLKAKAAARKAGGPAVIVAADLVVSFRGKILGKPEDAADARRTLAMLSGRTNRTHTGVTVLDTGSGRSRTACVSCSVRIAHLSPGEIARYVATGEPLDKAGSYAIKGTVHARGVRTLCVRGSRSAIIGLPKRETMRFLRGFGIRPRAGPRRRRP